MITTIFDLAGAAEASPAGASDIAQFLENLVAPD
jgi:hypothetical protein